MYDFDTVVDRRNTGSLKWDVAENELPMWEADMDLESSKENKDDFKERVDHGVFGYLYLDDSIYNSIISWTKNSNKYFKTPIS